MAPHHLRPKKRDRKTFSFKISLKFSATLRNQINPVTQNLTVPEYPKQTWFKMSQRFRPHKRMNYKHQQRWDAWHGRVFFTHWQHERCGSLSEWQGFKTKKRPKQWGPLDKFVNVLCL